jgi:hypothetical protein
MDTAHEYTSRGHGLDSILMCRHCDCERTSKVAEYDCPVLLARKIRILERQVPHHDGEPVTQAALNALISQKKQAELALATTTDLHAMSFRDNLRATMLKKTLAERGEAKALLEEVCELLNGGFDNMERFDLADKVAELIDRMSE